MYNDIAHNFSFSAKRRFEKGGVDSLSANVCEQVDVYFNDISTPRIGEKCTSAGGPMFAPIKNISEIRRFKT